MALLRSAALGLLALGATAAAADPAAFAGAQLSVTSSLTFDAQAAKNRPVTKVINLLKDMLKTLEKEGEDDEEIYDKIGCWCVTYDKEKTKAIADAEAKIKDLTSEIEELSAASARLSAEIENLKKEVAQAQEAIEKATAIRRKELAEFNAEEKDSLEAISALKAAIVVLSKHHSSMLQVPHPRIADVATTLQYQMSKHADIFARTLTHKQRRLVAAFVQQPQDYFDAEPTFKQSYAPQSGQIFGILKQMKETFESNLSASQKEEMAAQKAYEELKAAKEDEIAAGLDQIETKTTELADTDEKLATAKQDLEDTKNTLSADEQFLMMLKEKCQRTDQDWESRQKTRQLEMEAVSKALAILTSDDAHDLFTKTFNPAFVQKQGAAHKEQRVQASKLLETVARKLQSPKLQAMALQVRLDAFTKVKKAIDDMVAQLIKEKEDEIKQRDFCIDEFNSNKLDVVKKEQEKADLVAKISDLDHTIKTLAEEIAGLKASVAEMQGKLKEAGTDRETENKEFQQTVADQRATIKLLQAALTVLKDFYDKKAKAVALAQKQGPPAPPGFKEYNKNAASGGVMRMIQSVINEAKDLEAAASRDEAEAQKAYEGFVKETDAAIAEANKEIINKSDEKAKAEGEKTEAEENLETAELEMSQLSNYNLELHGSCDFVLKNFELRQTAREEEIEALKQAKAILSGAKFEAFLETGP